MQAIIDGILSKRADLQSVLSQITAATTQYEQYQRDLDLLKAKSDYEAAKKRGDTAVMTEAAQSAQAIRSSGPTSDPNNQLSSTQLRDLLLLQAKEAYEAAKQRGDKAAMEEAARRAQEIRASGPTSDPNNQLSASELRKKLGLPQAHTGAFVMKDGIAELKKGEIVLPPELTTQFMRLADILPQMDFTPVSRSSGFERAILDAIPSLGDAMPKEIRLVAELDGEKLVEKTLPIMGRKLRQDVRSY